MEFLQPFAAILLVMSCLGGGLVLLRRRGLVAFNSHSRAHARELELIEKLPLGPQHAVHLVRAGGRTLLVATSPSSCQFLDHEDRP